MGHRVIMQVTINELEILRKVMKKRSINEKDKIEKPQKGQSENLESKRREVRLRQ